MTAIKISVIGKSGQLARALGKRSKPGIYDIQCYGRDALDLTSDLEQIRQFMDRLDKTDILINAAAYTAVDNAEDDPAIAYKVNAETPGMFAKICADRNIPLIHVSTDYVFDGQKRTPYKINDPTDALGVYGTSKLAGEHTIAEYGGIASILRTSWVYDGIGKNFFTTMLRLSQDRTELGVVSDQFGRPTYAGHLADAILRVAEYRKADAPNAAGVFHVSGAGVPIHWANFAKSIFDISRPYRSQDMKINEILSIDFPTRATRPAYSVLDISHFEKTFQMKLPDWQEGLKDALTEWVNNQGRSQR